MYKDTFARMDTEITKIRPCPSVSRFQQSGRSVTRCCKIMRKPQTHRRSWCEGKQRSKIAAPVLSWWLGGPGGGAATPVGRVSASFRGSVSKETWEGSTSPRHALPRCTLHLSGTSTVTTQGLWYWWNSWLVSTLVHLFSAKNKNVEACGKRASVDWFQLYMYKNEEMHPHILRLKKWPLLQKIIWWEKPSFPNFQDKTSMTK